MDVIANFKGEIADFSYLTQTGKNAISYDKYKAKKCEGGDITEFRSYDDSHYWDRFKPR